MHLVGSTYCQTIAMSTGQSICRSSGGITTGQPSLTTLYLSARHASGFDHGLLALPKAALPPLFGHLGCTVLSSMVDSSLLLTFSFQDVVVNFLRASHYELLSKQGL